MKQIIYNARTAEVTEIEVEDIGILVEEVTREPTIEERLQSLEVMELERILGGM